MNRDYQQFLAQKAQDGSRQGFEPRWMPDWLFGFQQHLVAWNLTHGKSATFADCGLGKTPMQLVVAQNIVQHTNRPVLILTPLAVAQQTVREAAKFDIECVRTAGEIGGPRIYVTNYEKLHHFSPHDFGGVVCDESSAIKSFDGQRRKAVTEFLRTIPYRLLCTATAAPNDYLELGTSSEALGHLGYMDMLSRFFVNDQNTSKPMKYRTKGDNLAAGRERAKWRFKGHAATPFWRWVCSWARACRKPSDLGFDDDGFILPPLIEREHVVEAATLAPGMLFPMAANGLKEEREERRRTLRERCEKAAELVAQHDRSMIWCHLNKEGDLLEEMIPGALQVKGADSDDWKEMATEWFTGHRCICNEPAFSVKLAAWRRARLDTGASFIRSIASRDLQNPSATDKSTETRDELTCGPTTGRTARGGRVPKIALPNDGSPPGSGTRPTLSTEHKELPTPGITIVETRTPSSREGSPATASRLRTTTGLPSMDAQSADAPRTTTPGPATDSISTTATRAEDSGACSAPLVTLGSESSRTIQEFLSEPQCICGHRSGVRRLIAKPVMFGWGLNLQMCAHIVTFGSHSYEQYYQSVRRCWRFGQTRPVTVDLVLSEGEAGVRDNLRRKSEAADRMFTELVAHMNDALRIDGGRSFTDETRVPAWL